MEQQNLKATELDKMTCSYDLQMLKAALTYFPPQPKRFLSVLVKVQELKNTLRLISSTENAGFLNICSTPEDTPKQGFFDILNEIKDYGSPEQQKLFERLNQAIKIAGMYEQLTQESHSEGSVFSGTEETPSPELKAASLKETAPPSPGDHTRTDFRTYIRESLSPENQALFDSYRAMFHTQNSPSRKET